MGSIPADKIQVFGCSTAALDVTTAFARQGNYSFPVLADPTHAAALAYGCLRPDGAASERWTFLIDDKGMITAINRTTSPESQGADVLRMLADGGLLDAALLAPVGVTGPAANGWGQRITLQVGARSRTCTVHMPPVSDGKAALPVVIVMHGARGSGQGMAAYTGGQRGTEVQLVVADRCGHGWPIPEVGLSASQELWDFFSKHPKAP